MSGFLLGSEKFLQHTAIRKKRGGVFFGGGRAVGVGRGTWRVRRGGGRGDAKARRCGAPPLQSLSPINTAR